MDKFKSLFESKTFWGAILAMASGIGGLFGYTFGAEEQQVVMQAVSAIGTGIGSIIAVYGRVTATKMIK